MKLPWGRPTACQLTMRGLQKPLGRQGAQLRCTPKMPSCCASIHCRPRTLASPKQQAALLPLVLFQPWPPIPLQFQLQAPAILSLLHSTFT